MGLILCSAGMTWTVCGASGVMVLLLLAAVAFVDCVFSCLACMWPFTVLDGFGSRLRSCFVVMVENELRKLALIASARVDIVGENSVLDWNYIRSTMVGASITELSEWCCCTSII